MLARKMMSDFCANIINIVKKSITSKDFVDRHKYSPTDFTRKSPLDFATLFTFMINLLRSSNQIELEKFFKQIKGEEISDCGVSDSAFSQARKKLHYGAFIEVNSQSCKAFYQDYSWKTWNQFRLLGIDGSTIKIYGDDYCKSFFGLIDNGSETPYALARISQCYDVLNHITLDASIVPNSIGEREMALAHLDMISPFNDLLLFDRGYPGFCFFRQIMSDKRQFCARAAVGSWTSITEPFLQSGLNEQIIQYTPSKDIKAECRRLGLSTDPMTLRLIRIELKTGETEILITSLTYIEQYPHDLFEELYHLRWPVEEAYKLLKCKIEIEKFSGKSLLAVKQDFFAKILMFNLTSMLIAPIDDQLKIKTKNYKLDYKVNRTRAFAKMKEFGILLFFRDSINYIVSCLHKLFMVRPTEIRLNRSFQRKNDRKKSHYSFAYQPIS